MRVHAGFLMACLSLAALAGAAGAQVQGPMTKVPKGAAGQAGQQVAPPLQPRRRTLTLTVLETSSPYFVSPGEPVLVRFKATAEETGTGDPLSPIGNAMVCDGDVSQGRPDCVKLGSLSTGQAMIRDVSLRAPAPGTAPRIILTTGAASAAARAAGAAGSGILAEASVALTRLPAPDMSIALSANDPEAYWRGDRLDAPSFAWTGAQRDLTALHSGPDGVVSLYPGPTEAQTYRVRCKVWSANAPDRDNMGGTWAAFTRDGPAEWLRGASSGVQGYGRTRQVVFFAPVGEARRRLDRIDLSFPFPWWFEACQIDLWRARLF